MSVSVIIPSFNRGSVLPRAIDSVYSQSWRQQGGTLELILVDDGSTDDTAQLITKNYPEIRYYYQKNQGVSAARNVGLQHAQHEWIALLDSDDEWLPDKLSRQMKLLEQSDSKVCHTEEIWIRNGVRVNQMNKHKKAGGWIFDRCLPLCAMSPSSSIIHKGVFERVGLFDENLPACEDYDLWLRICSKYPVAYESQACIQKYGGHEDQLSRQYWGMDRFRVIALEKILVDDLDVDQYQAAKSMLMKKLNILLNGAQKRNNLELIKECEQKLAHWQA